MRGAFVSASFGATFTPWQPATVAAGRSGRRPSRLQSGSTLLEVLVAILLLSLGFLAVASVHASAFKYGKMSEFRSTAVSVGSALIERMRANPAGVSAAAYLSAADKYPADPLPSVSCGDVQVCDPGVIAQADQSSLQQLARSALPQGDLYVRQNTGVSGATVYEVWVRWTDPDDVAAAQTRNVQGGCPGGAPNCVLLTTLF
jgi:type IV pilus assembly protein PilV